jgi:hypothetical protein
MQILKDSDTARREVILHKKACENCQYIVQVMDIYVRILDDFVTLSYNPLASHTPGKYV